ncbi:unnamed protein product [Peniophora sp. CBMAI 1063]|nr:unnamed protein product [Peniophora sp. CBMAI 1063]
MNVPKDWVTSPFRWLYRVILALDANFRLSNKLTKSTKETDPNLTDGRAYMAPWDDYALHTKDTANEVAQKSTCSKFAALEMADTRGSKRQRSTGVAGCVCARHGFVQTLGIAPLIKGERQESMDWVFCGALAHIRAPEVTLSYDVVCQYCVNLGGRLARIRPTSVIWAGAQSFAKLSTVGHISYVVPKFHLYAHKFWCQIRYAFGLLFGTAITDGEEIERLWSGIKAAAPSLREMGPGANNDTMDDIFGAWNWMKTCTIGLYLRGKMDRALDEGTEQTVIHTGFDEAMRADHPEEVTRTQARIATWGASVKTEMSDEDCPYYTPGRELSVPEIMSQTDGGPAVVVDMTVHVESPDDVALAQCLERGMKIEDERQRVTQKIDVETELGKPQTKVLDALVNSILIFRAEQEFIMPTTYAALTAEECDPSRKTAMTVQLGMPSAPPDGDTTVVSEDAKTMEAKLRWEAMKNELNNLMHHLRLKGCLYRHRKNNSSGQQAATRSLTTQVAVHANIEKAASAYRRHREAYLALEGGGSWETTMRKLADSDCRPLSDKLVEQMEKASEKNIKTFLEKRRKAGLSGKTDHKVPWIWYNTTIKSGSEFVDGSYCRWSAVGHLTYLSPELMTEWAKSLARAQHWLQEVRLVDAEMQRVIDFNESMASIWDVRRDCEVTIDVGEEQSWASDAGWVDGKRAYALKQAHIRRSQAENWRKEFATLRAEARRFLLVHTEEGIALDPSTLLSAEEVEDMERRAKIRHERRTKTRREKDGQAAPDLDYDSDEELPPYEPFEEDSDAGEDHSSTGGLKRPAASGKGAAVRKPTKTKKSGGRGGKGARKTRRGAP